MWALHGVLTTPVAVCVCETLQGSASRIAGVCSSTRELKEAGL
jgi:hypothetical protein